MELHLDGFSAGGRASPGVTIQTNVRAAVSTIDGPHFRVHLLLQGCPDYFITSKNGGSVL